jgi:hypothetical protein
MTLATFMPRKQETAEPSNPKLELELPKMKDNCMAKQTHLPLRLDILPKPVS